MTRVAKIWQGVLRRQTSVPFRDFERLLRAFGFELDRIAGSHHIYVHRKARLTLSVQPDGSEAKGYQVRKLIALVEEAGLSMEGEQ
jgi:predicted RNA binding protein YcfA (HicA-like mRNA interferase family)